MSRFIELDRPHNLMRVAVLAGIVFAALAWSAAGAAAGPMRAEPLGFGAWDGKVTFDYHQQYPGATGSDHREYFPHGLNGHEGDVARAAIQHATPWKGNGQLRIVATNACGPVTTGWNWETFGDADTTIAVTDEYFELSFYDFNDATYTNVFTGVGNSSEGVCDMPYEAPGPTQGGTGIAGYEDDTHANREFLLNYSGSATITGPSTQYHGSDGSLGDYGTTMTVVWNLKRHGPKPHVTKPICDIVGHDAPICSIHVSSHYNTVSDPISMIGVKGKMFRERAGRAPVLAKARAPLAVGTREIRLKVTAVGRRWLGGGDFKGRAQIHFDISNTDQPVRVKLRDQH